MERKKASDFDQELLNLFDKYVHGAIDRRGFLDGAAKFAVGGVTAAMLLDALSPKFAEAQQVPTDDKRLKTERARVPVAEGLGHDERLLRRGRRRRPASCPACSSCTRTAASIRTSRTSRGASRSTTSSPSRPDALTPLGGYPGDEDKARELFGKLDQAKTREDFVAAAAFLKGRPECTGKIGVVGFCYGGGIANMLATRMPDLAPPCPSTAAR